MTKIHEGMGRQEIGQVGFHADRANSWPAPSMRDAEGFMKIEVANVGSEIGRPAKTNLRIHVRTVHVHLAAIGMNDVADLDDRFLKNAMGRRDR